MERLFENPILLFVIIAIISSMFSKVKGKPENKRPGRMPELARELRERYEEISKPEQRGTGRRPAGNQEPSAQPRAGKPEVRREAVIPVAAVEPTVEKMDETRRPLLQSTGKSVGSDEFSIEPVTEKNLADAVVWAEILGPPRSKKPYYKR